MLRLFYVVLNKQAPGKSVRDWAQKSISDDLALIASSSDAKMNAAKVGCTSTLYFHKGSLLRIAFDSHKPGQDKSVKN